MTLHFDARLATILFALTMLAFVAGCTSEEADEAARFHATMASEGDTKAVDDLFRTEVVLFRRYTGDKWRLDKDHVFTVKDESHVRAEVELVNLRPERTYSVHLAWIRPDGKEMFRRYAEITRHLVSLPMGLLPDSTGALPKAVIRNLEDRWGEEDAQRIAERLARDPQATVPVTERVYKKAVDLGYARTKVSLRSAATEKLTSNLKISREKQREPGAYLLRVYLDRRLLQEVPFEVKDDTWIPPAED